MTEINTQAVAVRYPEVIDALPEISTSTANLIMSSESMTNAIAFADIMASGVSTVPQHLRKSKGDCLAVTMQAMQWGMNPFAVAQKTHIVNGALGYEAQLVNAVVQASGAISGRFHYEYRNEGSKLECRVGAIIAREKEITWNEWLCVGDITTKNSPLWKTNPKQQIGYLQVKNWARAFTPGAILGVYTPDELEDSPRLNVSANVSTVTQVEEPSKALLKRAYAAADGGVNAFREWYAKEPKDERRKLANHIDDLKKRSEDAEKKRATKADQAASAETQQAAPAGDAPDVTPKIVEDCLNAAFDGGDIDELHQAADMIRQVNGDAHQEVLTKLYHELRDKLEA